MSSSRSAASNADADLAPALRDAPFVRVIARADGASLAASGILARALRETGVPFQVRVRPNPRDDADRDGDALVVTVGADGGDASLRDAAAVRAYETVRRLGASPNPTLALAGVVAAGSAPGADESASILDAAEERGLVERRPGVAVPTADLGDGLAHTTLAHAPFSGDPEATRAALADLALPADIDVDARQRIASLVAIEAATAEWATPRAATAVERALRPHATPDGPFATVEGYADVLDAVAREQPGTGVALALGHDSRTAALEAWRDHAGGAHRALRAATTARHSGLFVVRVDAPAATLGTVARLARDFRAPEPVALAVTDGAAAAAGANSADRALGDRMRDAAAALNGTGDGDERYGEARFDGDAQRFTAAFREAT